MLARKFHTDAALVYTPPIILSGGTLLRATSNPNDVNIKKKFIVDEKNTITDAYRTLPQSNQKCWINSESVSTISGRVGADVI